MGDSLMCTGTFGKSHYLIYCHLLKLHL